MIDIHSQIQTNAFHCCSNAEQSSSVRRLATPALLRMNSPLWLRQGRGDTPCVLDIFLFSRLYTEKWRENPGEDTTYSV